ncbi:MAG: hypothetical protein H8E15_04850 [Planctomycetes bacterium]|nr:hypothetical protein [Planctomycetota bacterium]
MAEFEVTFRYTIIGLQTFTGSFEIFFAGVKVGRRRKYISPFREKMIADPGIYEFELIDGEEIL